MPIIDFLIPGFIASGALLSAGVFNLFVRGPVWFEWLVLTITVSVALRTGVHSCECDAGLLVGLMVLGTVPGMLLRVGLGNLPSKNRSIAGWGAITLTGLVGVGGIPLVCDHTMVLTNDLLPFDLEHYPLFEVTDTEAQTDSGEQVLLRSPAGPVDQLALLGAEQRYLAGKWFHHQIVRTAPPERHANCHGWVFTNGRFLIANADVDRILNQNGYRMVSRPELGDLVIYRTNGVITHTAVVRQVSGNSVRVEGKWGQCGVFIHAVEQSPYGEDYAFMHSERNGHLLAGLR